MTFILLTLVEMETIVNPYYAIGELHSQGLDYVIDNLPATPTRKDLVNVVSDFGSTISGDDSVLEGANNKAFLSNLVNKGNCCKGIDLHDFDTDQRRHLGSLLNPPVDIAPTDLPFYYVKLENDIHNSVLTDTQKKLPMLGVAIARDSISYWNAQVAAGVASPWNDYVVAAGGAASIPKWIERDIEGGLAGFLGLFGSPWYSKDRNVLYGATDTILSAILRSSEAVLLL